MVAVIKSGSSIRNTFYYNEIKVTEGVASLLEAVNYPLNAEDLSEHSRLSLLERIAELRPGMKRPGIHISLNFSREEQLSDDRLKQISQDYMEAIGFGDQPYLLYRHQDAAHPHVHIVTLRVKPDGKDIDTFQIAKRLSRPAELALEEKHNLVRSADHKQDLYQLQPINATAITYARTPTKRAIGNVLSQVLDGYKYGSLEELNAVLRLYNVQADRGEEGSRLREFRGLIYRVLGPDGKGVSAPIKASAFADKAKLNQIEERFLRNDVERQKSKPSVRVAIDKAFRDQDTWNFPALKTALKQSAIDLVLHQNKDGDVYGITFIDHKNRTVFKGSDLGKNYGAKAIIERLTANMEAQLSVFIAPALIPPDKSYSNATDSKATVPHHDVTGKDQPDTGKSFWEMLLQPEYSSNYLPPELRKTKRKKKKRQIKS